MCLLCRNNSDKLPSFPKELFSNLLHFTVNTFCRSGFLLIYDVLINNSNQFISSRFQLNFFLFLFQFRSPLLSKSLLIFIPLTTEMFHFVRFSFFVLFLSGNFGLNGLLTYTNSFRFSYVPFYKLPRYPHRNLFCAFGSNLF